MAGGDPRFGALPHLAMVVAIVLWSTIYVAGKTAVALVPLAETIAWRFLLAAACLWMIVAWRRDDRHRRHRSAGMGRRRERR